MLAFPTLSSEALKKREEAFSVFRRDEHEDLREACALLSALEDCFKDGVILYMIACCKPFKGDDKHLFNQAYFLCEAINAEELSGMALFYMSKMIKERLISIPNRTDAQVIQFLHLSVMRHYPDAYASLGVEYLTGLRVEKDKQRGLAFLDKGVSLGSPMAMYLLSHVLSSDFHFTHDKERSKALFQQAKELDYYFATERARIDPARFLDKK